MGALIQRNSYRLTFWEGTDFVLVLICFKYMSFIIHTTFLCFFKGQKGFQFLFCIFFPSMKRSAVSTDS